MIIRELNRAVRLIETNDSLKKYPWKKNYGKIRTEKIYVEISARTKPDGKNIRRKISAGKIAHEKKYLTENRSYEK